MPQAYVQRGAGLSRGADIIDPLMATEMVLLERGRSEIDAASSLQKVNVTCNYRGGVQRGQHALFHDGLQGTSYYGKIVGIAYKARGASVLLDLTVLRIAQ